MEKSSINKKGDKMLEEKTIKESLKIENSKAYAVFSLPETKRQIDGCRTRKEISTKILDKRNEIAEINKQRDKANSELAELLELDNKLTGIGCCRLSKPIYKTIDGLVQKDSEGLPIIDHYTHDEYCTHKEEGELW